MEEYLENLTAGTSGDNFKFARGLRQTMTEVESFLWEQLRGSKLHGKKFRRQHPVADFTLDFYCHEVKLGIEVDGGIHSDAEQHEYDKMRTKLLAEFGIRIIRFTNKEVKNEIKKVLNEISNT